MKMKLTHSLSIHTHTHTTAATSRLFGIHTRITDTLGFLRTHTLTHSGYT